MNDVEDRLHRTLDAVVPHQSAGPALLASAVARATRIRRRRVATRSAVGAAAVAGGMLVAHRGPASAPAADGIHPVASSTATAPGVQPGITLTAVEGGCTMSPQLVTGPCLRWVVEIQRVGGATESETLIEEGFASEVHPLRARPQDPVIGIELDGVLRTLTGRPDGPGRWVFDVAIPDDAEVGLLSLQTDDGTGMDCGDVPRPRLRCP